jgi:shikimate dehydrogenase
MNVTAATKLYGVIGDPVSHSLSPVLHNGWLSDHAIDAIYLALPVRGEEGVRGLRGLGFGGLNVTIPHKEAALALADRVDELAARLGAANVLRRDSDGALVAFNTDSRGFVAGLDEAHPNWRVRTKTALIVGAGGAARAIAAGLADAGVGRIVFCNRTDAAARAAAARIAGAAIHPFLELPEAVATADLIVNATSLGMVGQADLAWPLASAPRHAIVADAVYKPLTTNLLRTAEANGLATLDGLAMLLHQAALAFELWFGVAPSIAAGRARLQQALKEQAQ